MSTSARTLPTLELAFLGIVQGADGEPWRLPHALQDASRIALVCVGPSTLELYGRLTQLEGLG
jgi:hypothetical protein